MEFVGSTGKYLGNFQEKLQVVVISAGNWVKIRLNSRILAKNGEF